MIRFIAIAYLLSLPVQASETLTIHSNAQKTAVVELYTSEGCSSCPPADKWLEALTEVPSDEMGVLALAFHVDYWDYIGWKDRFASPANTSRQRQLGSNNLQNTIYTPEFFVGGKEIRGTRNILKEIYAANSMKADIDLKLTISINDDSLQLELEPVGNIANLKILHHRFFIYEKNLVSDVTRGENSGEQLQHQHVVRYMSDARKLNASNRLNINIDPQWQLDNLGVAALVTTPGNQSYLQAVHSSITPLFSK